MKELLKITHLKDGVCEAKCDIENEHEKQMMAAAILGLMDKDKELAHALMNACFNYALHRKEVSKMNALAIESAKKKTQN